MEMNNARDAQEERERGCTELATVPRIKVQLTKKHKQKCQFPQQTVRRDRQPGGSNAFHLPSLRLFIHSVLSPAQMDDTEDYAQLGGSPGQRRLRSSSAPARLICALLFPEESLWTISGMPNRREAVGGGGVDYKASRNAPQNTVNKADNQLSTNPPACWPRPGHFTTAVHVARVFRSDNSYIQGYQTAAQGRTLV